MTRRTSILSPHHDAPRGVRRGFTIVEMLVTVAIIVILITILIVALSQAARGAQRARTQFLMTSINQGLAQFKGDHGYVPPVLGRNGSAAFDSDRDALLLPDPAAGDYVQRLQTYRSITTLAEFLLGYGDRSQDGYGRVGAGLDGTTPGDREFPTLGFRSPGDDGIWGAWTNPRPGFPAGGQLVSRNPGGLVNPAAQGSVQYNNDIIAGKVYGPYIDLSDERLIGCVNLAGEVFLPGEGGFDPALPKVIVDYWGQPIIYYRRLHQPRDPKRIDTRSNLADVFALRPWSLRPGEEIDARADANNDTTTTRPLLAAEHVLFSAGPDRQFDQLRRVDQDEFNRDNIVEIGQ